MNKRRVLNVLGKVILTEACLMIPSLIVSLLYGEGTPGTFSGPWFRPRCWVRR